MKKRGRKKKQVKQSQEINISQPIDQDRPVLDLEKSIIKKLIKQDYLYTDEKLREMKQTLKLAEEEFAELEAKESKGFK